MEGNWWWSEAQQYWALERDGEVVARIPGRTVPGSEHPAYYSDGELAEMIASADFREEAEA